MVLFSIILSSQSESIAKVVLLAPTIVQFLIVLPSQFVLILIPIVGLSIVTFKILLLLLPSTRAIPKKLFSIRIFEIVLFELENRYNPTVL